MQPILNALMRDEASRVLTDHWLSLPRHKNNLIPNKKDFSIKQIGRFLPNVFIIDIRSEHEAFLKLSGSRINHMVGMEMTGVNLVDYIEDSYKQVEEQFYYQICNFPCAAVKWRLMAKYTTNPVVFRGIYLPFANENGNAQYLIGMGTTIYLPSSETTAVLLSKKENAILGNIFVDIGAGIPGENDPLASTINDFEITKAITKEFSQHP